MSNSKGISLRYVRSIDDPILDQVNSLATEFFSEEADSTSNAVIVHAMDIGSVAVVVSGESLIGWSLSFPVGKDATERYMEGELSERRMLWDQGDMEGADAYLACVFVKPEYGEEYGEMEAASLLLDAATSAALKGGGSVVYSECSEQGKRIGEFFRRSAGLSVVRSTMGLPGGTRIEVKKSTSNEIRELAKSEVVSVINDYIQKFELLYGTEGSILVELKEMRDKIFRL